jgi:hypothetical protein
VSVSVVGLAAVSASLAGMIIGVILIGRSKTLAEVCADPADSVTEQAQSAAPPPQRARKQGGPVRRDAR